jgi:outer membrane protein assembly factor BamB
MKSEALAVQVERRIFLVRGQKVMLDADLAELYPVPTKSLNLAVKRNAARFPGDFMFRLTDDEVAGLRFHFETSNWREAPIVGTDQQISIGGIFSSPLIVNGVVYFGSADGFLYAVE